MTNIAGRFICSGCGEKVRLYINDGESSKCPKCDEQLSQEVIEDLGKFAELLRAKNGTSDEETVELMQSSQG